MQQRPARYTIILFLTVCFNFRVVDSYFYSATQEVCFRLFFQLANLYFTFCVAPVKMRKTNDKFCGYYFKFRAVVVRMLESYLWYLWFGFTEYRCIPTGVSIQVYPYRCIHTGVYIQVYPYRCTHTGVYMQVYTCRCIPTGVSLQVYPYRCIHTGVYI